MASNPIQWFPGHMAKTKRLMRECLPEVDVIIELLDARIPYSSKNPEIDSLVGTKPRIIVFTKSTLANPALTQKWAERYAKGGAKTVIIDSTAGIGIDALAAAVKDTLSEKIERYHNKGMDGRKLKAMIVGIPNVGKSSLINRIAGSKKARVSRGNQARTREKDGDAALYRSDLLDRRNGGRDAFRLRLHRFLFSLLKKAMPV